jgi:hypothetical protein
VIASTLPVPGVSDAVISPVSDTLIDVRSMLWCRKSSGPEPSSVGSPPPVLVIEGSERYFS